MLAPPPARPTLPVASSRRQLARTLAVPVVNWGLAHRPDQRRRLFMGDDLREMFDLRFRQAGHALHFGGRPLGDLVADLVHPPDPLPDEFLVLPPVLENVPQHSVD